MFWYPKSLKCQIYENGNLLDLNKCGDAELEHLSDAIYPLWRTPVNSAVWFSVEIYEKQHFFKPPSNSIEIEAYIRSLDYISGRQQVSISKLYLDKMVGRKFPIKPDNTYLRTWGDKMEVMFVV